MSEITGVDVSHWQWWKKADNKTIDLSRPPDWSKLAGKVAFGAVRATIGLSRDVTFQPNLIGFQDAGLLTTAYHVVVPNVDPHAQMESLFAYIQPYRFDLPLVLDCELTNEQDNWKITACIEKCVDFIEQHTGREPIIYTSQGWWNPNVRKSSQWKRLPLWVANYTAARKPAMPRDWETWHIWQWSKTGPGREYGAKSQSIDLNRWNGTLEELQAFCNIPAADPDPETPMQITHEMLVKMWNHCISQGMKP